VLCCAYDDNLFSLQFTTLSNSFTCFYLVFGPTEAQGDEFAINWRSIFARNFLYTVGASRIIAADVAYMSHSERRCCRHRYQLRRRHG
jgi:hypothetical protein